MKTPDSTAPSRRRRLPVDPALVAWVVVALMALVPLEHAVASIVAHTPLRGAHARAAPAASTGDAQAARAAGSGTP